MRTYFEIADEIERIEALPIDRAEKDQMQKTLLETLRILKDIERIRTGQVREGWTGEGWTKRNGAR